MQSDQTDRNESDFPRTIGNPATRALALAGYRRLEQLTGVSEKELLALHGVGPKAVRLLRAALAERGLAFAGEQPSDTQAAP